jgi:hypothetical protein
VFTLKQTGWLLVVNALLPEVRLQLIWKMVVLGKATAVC